MPINIDNFTISGSMIQDTGLGGIITDGLVLHLDAAYKHSYPMGGTTWYDLTQNGNNTTLLNGPTFSTSNEGIIDFDGTNDYCNVGTLNQLNTQYCTQEIWVKLDTPNDSIGHQFIARANTSNGTFTIGKSNTNQLFANTRNSSDTFVQLFLNTPVSTNWINFVHSYDGTTIRVYINGVLDNSSTALSGPLNTGGTLQINIARNNNGLNYLNGKIGSVRIYNRGLSSSEILQNYNATKGRFVI